MAGIDKTYIDGKEYPIYRQWWIDHYDQMIKEMSEPIWLYPFGFFYPIISEITPDYLRDNKDDLHKMQGVYDYPIWNTSEQWDKWLIKNCSIQSFRDRMLDVYDHKWFGFKGQKWIPK